MGNSNSNLFLKGTDSFCCLQSIGYPVVFKQHKTTNDALWVFPLTPPYIKRISNLTCANVDLTARKKACRRRNLASSVTFVTALISTTQKTVQLRRRCQMSLPIQLIMAAEKKSAPIVTSVRCSGTGQPIAMMMRPSNPMQGQESKPRLYALIGHFTPPAFVCAGIRKRDNGS